MSGLKIQKFAKGGAPAEKSKSGEKNEDYYFNKYPIEMCSVLASVYAETLVQVGSIEDQHQIPIELMRLVSHGQRKADPAIEQEIYSLFLS